MQIAQNRRNFLAGLSASGLAAAVGSRPALAGEALETTTVRFSKVPGICIAPQYVVNDLLALEGITEANYAPTGSGQAAALAVSRGEIDFALNFVASLLVSMDAGEKLTVLASVHPGCFELFAREDVVRISDLRGASVGLQTIGSAQHLFVASMAAYVGLDPATDIRWIANPDSKPKELFLEGKIDAFLGFPPEPQELRARKIGRVVVNSAIDPPWSQYFCCMLVGNRDFVQANPATTKRVVRAILKATDLCATAPHLVAQQMVEDGFTNRYDLALQTLKDVPYRKWRDYDAEDAIRFYALRLHEAGMVKSSPQQMIAEGTDWSFLNELKRELKA